MKATYITDFEEWSSGFTYAVPLTVRFSDIDMYGIVNNAVIISYFEYARIEYLKHIGLMKDWINPTAENVPVIADIQCDYVKPIVYDEKLQIYVKINSVGTSSMDIHYLGKNDNKKLYLQVVAQWSKLEGILAKGSLGLMKKSRFLSCNGIKFIITEFR